MTDTIQLMKQRILDMAVRGELVEQRSEEGQAKNLLSKIKKEKEQLSMDNKIKKIKKNKETEEALPQFKIPENWVWSTLDDLAIKINAGGDKPNSFSEIQTDKYKYPVIANGITNEGIVGFTESPQVEELSMTISGRGTIGYTVIRDYSYVPIVRLLVVVPSKYVNIKYLKVVMDSMLETGVGSAVKQLTRPMLKKKEIPLPPLSEQLRIVEKIEAIFHIIEKLADKKEDALQTIQLIRQTTLQQAIQGKLVEQNEEDETVSELIIRIKEERKKLLKEKIISKGRPILPITDEDIPFKLPDNWSWIRLGEVVSFKIGKTPRRAQDNYWGEGIPWISISDMNSGRISITNEEVTDKAIEEVFKNEISKKGTLIMSFKLTIGKTAIMDIDAVHNEAIISIFPFVDHDKCFRDYLLHVLPLVSNKGDFKSAIKGNTLNSTSITNLMIPLPPLSEQKRIVEKIEQIMDICDQMEELFK